MGRADTDVEDIKDETVKRRYAKAMTRVAAGHYGGVLQDLGDQTDEEDADNERPGEVRAKKTPAFILKVLDDVELAAYKELSTSKDDPMHDFVPRFAGESEVRMQNDDDEEEYPPGRYIRLSNVLLDFGQPFVMDVKMGVRSFMESECKNTKLREDLYQRMLEINPEEPTEEERAKKAITKHRWMSFRDNLSSSVKLGFRIDGMAGPGHLKLRSQEFSNLREKEEVVQELLGFLPPAPRRFRTMMRTSLRDLGEDDSRLPPLADDLDVLKTKIDLANDILEQLRRMLRGCEGSNFFKAHEFVGSSLLFVADQKPPRSKVFMIDFAKTHSLGDEIAITHRAPWELGNHEDGLLFGLENLIGCWEEVISLLWAEVRAGGKMCKQTLSRDNTQGTESDEAANLLTGCKWPLCNLFGF